MRTGAVRSTGMRLNDMHIEGNVHYLLGKPRRAVALSLTQRPRGREFLMAGSYIVTGALIGFALANMPALAGAVATAVQTLSVQ